MSTNPDRLYDPGSVTFFFDPRTGRVDCANHPARHFDMLNENGCKLGRQYLTPEQHDFDGIPLTRSKVTYFGIVAGRFRESEGKMLISIWNLLSEEMTKQVALALVKQQPAVHRSFAVVYISSDGYHDGTPWRRLADLLGDPRKGSVAQ